ncbi:MAG: TraB/GumN family protein [Saprospiraceae bacterium]|nr:TraB/GumN family protein [Saprospiraceae bacterium]
MTKNSLLWKITPPDGGPASYLFGTMHVRDLRAFGWLETAKRHIDACETFATEFDFSDADETALAEALRLPNGATLDTLLKPSVWKNLDFYCRKKLGCTAEIMRSQHPMAVMTALSTAFLTDESAHSLDEALWHHARAVGKKTTGVETFADQLETLRKIPLEQHLKSLTWLLKNYGRQKRRLKKMMGWYASGDIRQLYQAAKKDAKGMRRVLLYERNKLMAGRFAEIAREHTLFCAVGAGHLAGGKGMLRLLKKAGFKVKPVQLDQAR